MKIKRLLFAALLLTASTSSCLAQDTAARKPDLHIGRPNEVAAGMLLPLGDFSSTHFAGFQVEYSRSKHLFGKRVLPETRLSYLVTAGISYYMGKKETVSGYPYLYPGYTQFHAYGGILVATGAHINIGLTAGPGASLYNGDFNFATGAKLEVTYYFTERWGVKPGLLVIKESGADPLLSASLKATFTF